MSEIGLTEADWNRIKSFAETPGYRRKADDLLPGTESDE